MFTVGFRRQEWREDDFHDWQKGHVIIYALDVKGRKVHSNAWIRTAERPFPTRNALRTDH